MNSCTYIFNVIKNKIMFCVFKNNYQRSFGPNILAQFHQVLALSFRPTILVVIHTLFLDVLQSPFSFEFVISTACRFKSQNFSNINWAAWDGLSFLARSRSFFEKHFLGWRLIIKWRRSNWFSLRRLQISLTFGKEVAEQYQLYIKMKISKLINVVWPFSR